ncbi:MAG: hypothetical protein ACREUU_05350, partial [Gammaproteobacteria bacterium]
MLRQMNPFAAHARPRSSRTGVGQSGLIPGRVLVCRFLVAALLHIATASARAQAPAPPASPPLLLTNAQQIAALGTNFAAGAYSAQLQAVVIYVSPQTRRLYVQDGDLGVQINHAGSVAPFRVGHRVEIGGTVLGGGPTLRLSGATATVIGDSPLPEPKLVSVHGLVKGEDAYRYVRVRGVVRDMFSNKAGLTLQLSDGAYPFEVAFQTTNAPLPRDWTDADIEVRGHCYPIYGPNGRPTGLRFHATSTNDVRVRTPGIADRFDGRPLLTIAEAARLSNNFKP